MLTFASVMGQLALLDLRHVLSVFVVLGSDLYYTHVYMNPQYFGPLSLVLRLFSSMLVTNV